MNIIEENTLAVNENGENGKRKVVSEQILISNKRIKTDGGPSNTTEDGEKIAVEAVENGDNLNIADEISTFEDKIVPQSPKKRLSLDTKTLYTYGNYKNYYGYRSKDKEKKFFDVRLNIFENHREIFENKNILDIGCNSGFITMEIAKRFKIKNIIGLDIDRSLTKMANKFLAKTKKTINRNQRDLKSFPFNVTFTHGNYVLKDDVLLDIERERFDIILCLSVTKWIHLNFGDSGLKQSFRRMFLQLNKGGKLILEAQPFSNYKRRKNLTPTTRLNYDAMSFLPAQFTDYLLSPEVGFQSVELLGVPDHIAKGFKRPIQVFHK